MEKTKFEPVHDSFLKSMHLIRSYIRMHSNRLNVDDASFLEFIAKEVIVNLYAEACSCANEDIISEEEFIERSNDLFRQAHQDMIKEDIENNLN